MRNQEIYKLESNISKMYLIKFLSGLHFISGVLIPFFMGWGHLSMLRILFLQSWFMFWAFIFEVPTGAVADYFGRKYSLMLGNIAQILGVLVYIAQPSFYVFLVGEFFFAAGMALISGADEAVVYESLRGLNQHGESKKVFARLQSATMMGILVAAPIGSFIGVKFGVQYAVLFMAVPFMASSFVTFTITESKAKSKTESESLRYLHILRSGFNYFHSHKILKILVFDFISIAAIGYFIIWLYQLKLEAVGVPIIYFGWIHAAMVFMEMVFINSYTWLEVLFGNRKRVLLLGGLVGGPLFIAAAFTSSWWVVVLWAVLGGGVTLSRRPLFASYFNAYIKDDRQRATVLSFINMVKMFMLTVLNPIVGWLSDVSLIFVMTVMGVLLVFFSFVSKVKEKHLSV